MSLAVVDLIFIVVTSGLIFLIKRLAPQLSETILIKSEDGQVIFSIAKAKVYWLIIGAGVYVWLMEFIIVNELLLLRLISPLLLEGSLFALLIVTKLGSRKLGQRLTIIGFILFLVSVIYLVI